MMKFETGNYVKLKEARQGRYFLGKIIKISGNLIRVGLSNGLYAEFPAEMWKIAERSEVSDEESEQ